MLELSSFYENPADEIQKRKLWYVHYLLIMAFGKACSSRSVERGKPPGVELFVQAIKLIPDLSHVWTDPFTAAEIFCCAALYFQCSDYRFAAYLMVRSIPQNHLSTRIDSEQIGHAIRTALFQGMHTDLPPGTFGDSQIERARHIWWTAYILDRELSSLMGLPVQLADENIHAKFPSMQSSEQAKGLGLHIKLCRIVAQVVSSKFCCIRNHWEYPPNAHGYKLYMVLTVLLIRDS
jgi:proline utilization trans-activator